MNINWEEFLSNLKAEGFAILINLAVCILVFIVAGIVHNLISKQTRKTIEKAKKSNDPTRSKELITMMTTINSVSRYVIYFIAILVCLNRLGFSSSISHILVTAGIGSLLLTIGAQSIVKDFVSGILMLFERQFAVGDYVTLGGYTGVVTAVGMRVTYLKTMDGRKVIIPNGTISTVINYGQEVIPFNLVLNVPNTVSSEEAFKYINQGIDASYKNTPEYYLERPQILGITNFNANKTEITINGTTSIEHLNQSTIQLRKDIKDVFDQNSINL